MGIKILTIEKYEKEKSNYEDYKVIFEDNITLKITYDFRCLRYKKFEDRFKDRVLYAFKRKPKEQVYYYKNKKKLNLKQGNNLIVGKNNKCKYLHKLINYKEDVWYIKK